MRGQRQALFRHPINWTIGRHMEKGRNGGVKNVNK